MPLYTWGRGEDGQLGLGDASDQYRPARVEILRGKPVIQIACGSGHTVVLTEDGVVWTWGRGDDGRLGHGDNGWKYVPRPVVALDDKVVRQVTCGSYHTAAVTADGQLWTWGGGMYGKLGHGNETGHSKPCLVQALRGRPVCEVACGSRHTVALLDNHEVYAWGDKENGVSGHGDTEGYQYVPRIVDALIGQKTTQISACGFHTCALTQAGEVFSFGEGKFGRLGHGNELNAVVPRRIKALLGVHVTQVACGGFHTACVSDDGVAFTWGGGEHGQLGHGDKSNKTEPCRVAALSDHNICMITCGWSHTVALTDSGNVHSWGNGDHGKLGYGDTYKVTSPRLVEALSGMNVTKIASYNEHTAALVVSDTPKSAASSFMSDLKSLINNKDFADVTFLVEGQKVYAHRALLAARCDHFQAMFSSGMRETREAEIKIEGVSHTAFLNVLEFLYTDALEVDPLAAVELYPAADLYTLSRLKKLCENRVQRGINVDNAAELMSIADSSASALGLRDICLRFIVSHFDAVTKSDGFRYLSRELILEVLQNR